MMLTKSATEHCYGRTIEKGAGSPAFSLVTGLRHGRIVAKARAMQQYPRRIIGPRT